MGVSDARLLIEARQRIRELQLDCTRLRTALDVELDNHESAMRHMAAMLVRYIQWHDAVWRMHFPRSDEVLRRLDDHFEILRAED